MKQSGQALLKKALIALVLAMLVFSKQIAFFLQEDNRYYFLWQSFDSLGLLLDVLLLAVFFWVVAVVLGESNWARTRRVAYHLFLIVLASSVYTLIPHFILPPLSDGFRNVAVWAVIWVATLGLIAFSYISSKPPLVRYGVNFCLVFSPLVLILTYQILTVPTWGSQRPGAREQLQALRKEAGDAEAPPKHPVFIFVFDEWSPKRTTEDGEFLKDFPNMRALSEQSINFTNAWSFSTHTYHSLPAILYQTDRRIQIGRGQTYWKEDGGRVPTAKAPSIMQDAKNAGYVTALEGFYLPYDRMLGDQLDYCKSGPVFATANNLEESMALSAVRNLQWLTDPLTRQSRRVLEARIQSRRWYDLSTNLLGETLELIDHSPRNIFAFFHWTVPHGPFVFNADGSYHGQYPKGGFLEGLQASVDEYVRQLHYQDLVIGEIVSRLKQCGKFDDCLLIMTGDHSWRGDPVETEKNWTIDPSRRKVPLLVKIPGEKAGHMVGKTVYNNVHLRPIIDQVLLGKVDDQTILDVINHSVDVPIPTGKNSVIPPEIKKELKAQHKGLTLVN